MENLLQEALKYAAMGLSVFPVHSIEAGRCSCCKVDCGSPGKHPRTMNGCKDATTDTAQIKKWWGMWPKANIAIATGLISGIVVIDIDTDHGGEESLQTAIENYGSLPDTWESLTGGGGRHLFFRCPPDGIGNRGGFLTGVDLRGDGGYVVAPPSNHISGRNYEWELSGIPGEVPLAELPAQWLELCKGEHRSYEPVEIPSILGKGQRNDGLFRLAASMRARGLSEAALRVALLEENKTRCQPPLNEKEVELIASSAGRYQPGELAPKPVAIEAAEALELIRGKLPITDAAGFYTEEIIGAVVGLEEANHPDYFKAVDLLAGQKGFRRSDFNKAVKMYKANRSKAKAAGDTKGLAPVAKYIRNAQPLDGFMLPEDWHIDGQMIYRYETKGRDGEPVKAVACPHPIFPVERLQNIETGSEKIKLTYYRDNRWQEVIVDKSMIANRQGIVALADSGIQVTSESARHLITFLSDFETANRDNLPLNRSISRVGWLNLQQFSPYSDDLIFDGDVAFRGVYTAIDAQGDYEEWLRYLSLAKESLQLRAMLAASFAAPLLWLIDGQCFFLHLWGTRSGIGKSVALKAAMSVWGNPAKLWRSFNSTDVGLERSAGFFHSLPMGIDELQTTNSKFGDTKKLIYRLCQGQGRSRGKKNGGLELAAEWQTIFLSTGEQPLGEEMSTEGALARVIELYLAEGDYPEGLAPGKLAMVTGANYGHAGRLYIGKLKEWLNGGHKEAMDLHKAIVGQIENDAYSGKHINSVATLAMGDYLSSRFIFEKEADTAMYEAVDFALQMMGQLETRAQTNPILQAWDWTLSWIAANGDHFKELITVSPRLGVIKSNGPNAECYILSAEFNKAIAAAGFSPRAIVRGFVEQGFFEPGAGGNARQHKWMPGGIGMASCYVLSSSKIQTANW